jgi:cell division FtsZ-interacting protein ZapD
MPDKKRKMLTGDQCLAVRQQLDTMTRNQMLELLHSFGRKVGRKSNKATVLKKLNELLDWFEQMELQNHLAKVERNRRRGVTIRTNKVKKAAMAEVGANAVPRYKAEPRLLKKEKKQARKMDISALEIGIERKKGD